MTRFLGALAASLLLSCAKAGRQGDARVSSGPLPGRTSEAITPGGGGDFKSQQNRVAVQEKGRQEEGSQCNVAFELPPDIPADLDAAALHAIGQKHILAKNGPAAVAVLLKAREKSKADAAIQGDLATAFLQCRCYSEAIKWAESSAVLSPANVDIAANLAQTYQIAGRAQDAIRAYRRAIGIAPGDASAHNNLAVMLCSIGDLDEAEAEARAAARLSATSETYLINLGYILFRQNRLQDAEMILRRAVETAPLSADARNQLGLVLAAEQLGDKAIEAFRKALELDPNHRAAKENLEAIENGR